MSQILDEIDEVERKINRLINSPYEAHPSEILEVCRGTLRLLRQVAEQQEKPQ